MSQTEKQRDALRKAKQRAAARDVTIPKIKSVKRRLACLEDPYLFMSTYFGWIFAQPFTQSRREMVEAIVKAAKQSDDQAVAGPRGDGKTRSALFVALWLAVKGATDFPLIISKSGGRAARELKNLKDAMKESPEFAADFPELMTPILAIGRWAAAAVKQTVYGEYTDLEWGSEAIIFPRVRTETLRANRWNKNVESCANAQIFASLGIEGPIRGYSIRNRRPTLAIIDDIDDRESARSDIQTEARIEIIDSDVAGLGGPDRNVSRVMLCTLLNRTCAAYVFTDRKQRPSFHGQRHKLITKLPTNWGLSEEYIAMRQNRDGDKDPDAREAHRWYLAHRKQIEEGYETSNPYRFNIKPLGDGGPAEVSTLQSYLNWIADKDLKSALTELQNDPPEEVGVIASSISSSRIQRQLSGFKRREIPPGCVFLTQGIDCRKVALHWIVRAWLLNERRGLVTGYTIDYGVQDVWGTTRGSDEGLDDALKQAINARRAMMDDFPYTFSNGTSKPVKLTLIDAGWRTQAVYDACRDLGVGFRPAMGFGKSSGCVQASFSPPNQNTPDKKAGDHWFLTLKPKRTWLVAMEADFWKAWEHDRWMTDPDKPGALMLFGESAEQLGQKNGMSQDEKSHFSYAKHITAESEVEEVVKGAWKRYWKPKRDTNHYLDASYMADVAASMCGMSLAVPKKSASKAAQPKEPARKAKENVQYL